MPNPVQGVWNLRFNGQDQIARSGNNCCSSIRVVSIDENKNSHRKITIVEILISFYDKKEQYLLFCFIIVINFVLMIISSKYLLKISFYDKKEQYLLFCFIIVINFVLMIISSKYLLKIPFYDKKEQCLLFCFIIVINPVLLMISSK